MLSAIKKWFGSPASPDFSKLMADGAIVLDVRTKGEFDSGHLKGARHFPLDTLKQQVSQVKKFNKPVITVCRSGARSAVAKNLLKSEGIEAYNGGAWQSFGSKI